MVSAFSEVVAERAAVALPSNATTFSSGDVLIS
jgi:hypothetical protein